MVPRRLNSGSGSESTLGDQAQTSLSISRSTVVSPLAFTLKWAWKYRNNLDPSDPCAMVLKDVSVPPHWQPYVAVDDPDATSAKAVELGGAVLAEAMDVAKVGRIAVLRDPQGATFGILKPDPLAM